MGKAAFKGIRPQPKPSPAEMVALARAQDPSVPPAVTTPTVKAEPAPEEELVQLNVRIQRRLADQLADAAERERVSQRVIIARALAAVGFAVGEADLTDRIIRRRRGTSLARASR
ncbi:MAG: hypothetical protein JO110_08375 [Acetobacteraceae bacterium]|nr:hypothetical protein [Acetobacteraceae bacterium]